MSDIVSISQSEAQSVLNIITTESENAKNAIRRVMTSTDQLPNFKGPRAERYKTNTRDSMQKLTSAMTTIDECSTALKNALNEIVRAGS